MADIDSGQNLNENIGQGEEQQNVETVVPESSSLSSETGSWESVIPPIDTQNDHFKTMNMNISKDSDENKDILENIDITQDQCSGQRSKFVSSACFIDAASLVDEEEDILNFQADTHYQSDTNLTLLPAPSEPEPCLTVNNDIPKAFPLERLRYISIGSSTPNNSMSSLNASTIKPNGADENESENASGGCGDSNISSFSSDKEHYEMLSSGLVSEVRKSSTLLPQFRRIPSEEIRPRYPWIVQTRPFVPYPHVDSFPSFLVRPAYSPDWCNNNPNTTTMDTEQDNLEDVQLNSGPNISTVENKLESVEKSDDKVTHLDSDSSSKSQTFFIDLSSLPDRLPEETNEKHNETNNMFTMYIDLGETSTKKKTAKYDFVEKESIKRELKKKEVVKKESAKQEMVKKVSKKKETPPKLQMKKQHNEKSNNLSTPPQAIDTFEKLEQLCNDPNICISEIIKNPSTSETTADSLNNGAKDKSGKELTSERSPSRSKTPTGENQPSDMFVKLSDLDKPSSSSVNTEEKVRDSRMTRSIPENNWGAQKTANSPRSGDVISSFHSENALSLNRLFPHLKNGFSKSMSGSVSNRTRSPPTMSVFASPGEVDEDASDVSEASNVRSSMGRSTMESSTTEENSLVSSLIDSCQSRLGQDLLRMFLEEIAPDVIVEVAGRRIKAHKCILSSRCQYFAGILSGGWVESAGDVISLPSFTYNVVHFALCHIYSGLCTIPESVSLVELATLADMLCLEGLKEAIMLTLKAKYCHYFHYPCSVCVAGVLECVTLCALYELDDLLRKCVLWISKHFTIVWPTKSFASLPYDLLEKCYKNIVINMSSDNVIDTVCGCGITVGALGTGRWTEGVTRMCRRLVSSAAHFVAARLVESLRRLETLPGGLPRHARMALDECLAAAIERAQPEDACRAYDYLHTVVRDVATQAYGKPDLLANGITAFGVIEPDNLLALQAASLLRQVEAALVRAAPRVVTTQAFRELPLELRMKLRNLGCIMYGSQAIPNSPQHEILQRNVSPTLDTRPNNSTRHSASNRHSAGTRQSNSTRLSTGTRSSNSTRPSSGTKHSTGTRLSTGTRSNTRPSNNTRPNTCTGAGPCTAARTKTKTADSSTACNGVIDHVRTSFVPYVPNPVMVAHSLDSPRAIKGLSKSSSSGPPKIRTTKAAEERAKFNKIKSCNSQDRIDKSSQRLSTFENTMSSYLEPRSLKEEKRRANRKLGPQMCSSSESSRNASPVLARRERVSRVQARDRHSLPQASQTSSPRPHTAEPSTDSLSESQTSNRYATYTKTKHANGSVESVKPKCHTVVQATAITSKMKTKIPVYTKQNTRLNSAAMNPNECGQRNNQSKSGVSGLSAAGQTTSSRGRPERKLNGSLMNATKSSSAKMQPKVVKDSPKLNAKNNKASASTSKPVDSDNSNKTPVMERSDTFLKDEPTFGDKTTNFDVDDQ